MTIPKPDEETDDYIKYNQSVTFTENVKFEKKLIVAGDIVAWDIDAGDIVAGDIVAGNIVAWDIDAWNIDARDIVARDIDARNIDARNIDAWNIVLCENIQIKEKCTLRTKTLITNRSQREFKEWKLDGK